MIIYDYFKCTTSVTKLSIEYNKRAFCDVIFLNIKKEKNVFSNV